METRYIKISKNILLMKKKYILYMFFAFCSIIVNLGTQFATRVLVKNTQLNYINFFNFELGFILQLILGTVAGFVFKFIVDKFIIFESSYEGIIHTTEQLFIYTLFALITTAIFWGTEISFKFIFEFQNCELLGGFIGLFIGYSLKFFLDKRWVFDV